MHGKILKITEKIYNLYDEENYVKKFDKEELKKLLEEENNLYLSLDKENLINFFLFIGNTYFIEQQDFLNHEIVMFKNKNAAMFRRIFFKMNKIFLNTSEINEGTFMGLCDEIAPDIYLAMSSLNYEHSYKELIAILQANIEIEFLNLLMYDDLLLQRQKISFLHSMMFLSPYLEDKIIKADFDIDKALANIDSFYENLWEFKKDSYDEEFNLYLSEVIPDEISIMRSKMDLNNTYNLHIRSLFLRGLLCNLKKKKINKYHEEMNSDCYTIYNIEGQHKVEEAFEKAFTDKQNIKKRKTR